MAKSIRSKRKRKLRNVKRVRYGAKELEKLIKTVARDVVKKEDQEMKDISEIATVVDKTKLKEKADDDKMDDGTAKHVYNQKTLKDQFGSYPVWLHQRRGRKLKKTVKKNKKAKAKKKK